MRIILGAGTTELDGWISTQEDELNMLREEDFARRFAPASVDAFLSEHVWEHMTLAEGEQAAANCLAYLKPGGYMRVAVPDANFRNEAYQNVVKIGGPGDPDHPAASHKIVYDHRTLVGVFERAASSLGGEVEVTLLEYCDDEGDFHYTHWNTDDGMIGRSYRYDTRNHGDTLGMVSIIIDVKKPLIINAKFKSHSKAR